MLSSLTGETISLDWRLSRRKLIPMIFFTTRRVFGSVPNSEEGWNLDFVAELIVRFQGYGVLFMILWYSIPLAYCYGISYIYITYSRKEFQNIVAIYHRAVWHWMKQHELVVNGRMTRRSKKLTASECLLSGQNASKSYFLTYSDPRQCEMPSDTLATSWPCSLDSLASGSSLAVQRPKSESLGHCNEPGLLAKRLQIMGPQADAQWLVLPWHRWNISALTAKWG